MSHYANDYFDLDADRANATPTRWSGGSRVLVAGTLAPATALVAAIVLGAIGLVAAAALARMAPSRFVLPTCVVMAALAWGYSAPPLRLCARGLGEATTALVVTVLVPWLGFDLQAPDHHGLSLLALSVVPLALLQLAMLLAIEQPDAAGDVATGKRTLVVRLGAARAALLYAFATAAAYAWLPIAFALGLPGRVVIAALAVAPVAVWRIAAHRDRDTHERTTLFAVALLVVTSAAELVAWMV
jgi:1,4-dihydroxy-2-naphthoate octaprenyltransferase